MRTTENHTYFHVWDWDSHRQRAAGPERTCCKKNTAEQILSRTLYLNSELKEQLPY